MRESIGDPGLQSDMLPGALRDVAARSGDAGRMAGSLAKEGRDEVGREVMDRWKQRSRSA